RTAPESEGAGSDHPLVFFWGRRCHRERFLQHGRAPRNQWVQVADTNKGARRHSSFRHSSPEGYFLQWGFMGYVTEFYATPETTPPETPEYHLVYFDPSVGTWQNDLPYAKAEEWSRKLPPLHMCDSYQGITTGSWRPRLENREGVL